MYYKLHQRIKSLKQFDAQELFSNNLIGLEKESLRVNSQGALAQTSHPTALGSSLTHPNITTDYSEALLELITPPLNNIDKLSEFLLNEHKFVYQNLDNEYLWATSMPCILAGETSIPLAQYGSSNIGKMKTVYREGLGLRYGREMQVIAGVHFNFSLSEDFWSIYSQIKKADNLQQHVNTSEDLISASYFDLIRNIQRLGWIVPYLFGASPAVCKSFLSKNSSDLDDFDESTYFEPYATSLRMGDIGYQNNKENESGIKANYDSVTTYVDSLTHAINTNYPAYDKLGIVKQGHYQQLNGNILQIENEYYSTIRPKQILGSNEKPSIALKKRGVRYVELRSLDVNAFDPLGINQSQLYFLETFLIFCLLHESPLIDNNERTEIDENEMFVAHAGRNPSLKLRRRGQSISLKKWGLEVCDEMMSICKMLDKKVSSKKYSQSLLKQRAKFIDADLTPSARMLEEMRENNESFHRFAARKSKLHQHYFNQGKLSDNQQQLFKQQVLQSHQQQKNIEQSDELAFDEFLRQYFSQK